MTMSLDTFLLFLLLTFAICGRSLSYNNENNEMDQLYSNDKMVMDFLGSNILSGIDSSQFCEDPYIAFCGIEARNHSRPTYMKKAYRSIRNHLINILQQPVTINEMTSLSVEKTLFSKCMKLGLKSDNINLQATENFLKYLNDNVLDTKDSWKNVDKQLNSRGFGFTFFDITVERDPDNPRQTIIVIQPPLPSHIKNLKKWIDTVFDPANSLDQTQLPWNLFDTIDTIVPVKRLFRRWVQVIIQSSKRSKQERMRLNKWSQVYNERSSQKATHSKINWEKLILETFERLNIEVQESDNIIVRNKDYFFSLIDLLGDNENALIVLAIKTKIILENIRFIDFKYADALKHIKKSLFCYENTNLYGASYRLLRDLKRKGSNNAENYEILHQMVLNIANVLIFKINESKDLSPKEKKNLKAQVRIITWRCIKYKNSRDLVENYYENYNTDPSYLISILKYRKMLKMKQLKMLTNPPESQSASEPFSVIDLAKPRNRFILNVFTSSFLLSNQPIPTEVQKEIHYGIYGITIASFLYGLLNENRFDNDVDLTGRVNWYDHPIYPAKSLQCFVGEDVQSYGRNLASAAVSQIFGAHIAHNALQQDYEEREMRRPNEFLVISPNSELQALDADKLFFMAYGKYHCHLGQNVLRTVLLNLNEYQSAFQCRSMSTEPQCPLGAFEMQGKHRFVNKPF